MKHHLIIIFAYFLFSPPHFHSVQGWGGLFNRFSPEMLANMGYGGGGGGGSGGGGVGRAGSGAGGGFLEDEYSHRGGGGNAIFDIIEGVGGGGGVGEEDVDPCYGRPCTANDHCCPGSICVDVDGVIGSCIFQYGRRVGELCRRDSDCESGLVCADESDLNRNARICRPPIHQAKQYSETCHMSSECDISRGLCCQVQRRHRQAPRKICSYFKDPQICIGPVATDQITLKRDGEMEHTTGEKRMTVGRRQWRPTINMA